MNNNDGQTNLEITNCSINCILIGFIQTESELTDYDVPG